jgi:hypothetical protein
MAKQRGLGRGLAEIREAAGPQGGFHPFISSVAFDALTRQNHGATMDIHSGEFLDTSNPSKDTYVVGGEPDKEGNRIETTPVGFGGQLASRLPSIRRDILAKTSGREGVGVGSWRRRGGVDVDASAIDPNLGSALLKAKDRNEKAIFSTKKFRESGKKYDGDIANPSYKDK